MQIKNKFPLKANDCFAPHSNDQMAPNWLFAYNLNISIENILFEKFQNYGITTKNLAVDRKSYNSQNYP